MAHEVQVLSDTEVEVTLRVTGAQLDAAIQADLQEISKQVRIPGFRPGKVPKQVLLKRYGESVEKEARQRLVEETLREALREHELQPIKGPELDVATMIADADGTLETTLKLDVLPKVELREYKGLSADVPMPEVKPEDVDRELEGMRQQAAHPHDVEGAAEEGDFVQADVEYNFLDGTSLPPEPDQWIDTRSGAIGGMPCEAAVGKFQGSEVGSVVQLSVEIQAPHPSEERHGSQAVAHCTVKAIKRLHVPEKDDPEFLGHLGAESVVDLEQKMMERMRAHAAQQRDRMIEQACLDHLLEIHEFPIPQSYLNEVAEGERERIRNDLRQRETPPEQIETQLLEAEGRVIEGTARRVKSEIILDRIVSLENLQAEEEDLQRHFMAMSQALQIPPQELFDRMQENGSLPGVVAQILRDKARRFLREHAATADQGEQEVSSGTGEAPGASSEQETP